MNGFLRSKLFSTLIALVMIVAAFAIPLSGFVTRAHAQGAVTISEFPIPTNGNPLDITSGPDGNIWFVEFNGHQVGKITPVGAITEYAIPTSSANPAGITSGPDGNIWFTEQYGASQIGKITPTGAATEYPTPSCCVAPTGITSGPDGNIWFTEGFGNKIAKSTTGGAITEYTIPTGNSSPGYITSGPDGNIWFTEGNANQIGKITPTGAVNEYSIPTSNSNPARITSGPDGNVWFTEASGNKIGKITPNGEITEYAIPTSGGNPLGITSGPDGNIWFTEIYGSKIGEITTSGTITEYSLPSGFGYPVGITSGPDGNIWFTEAGGNAIGRVSLLTVQNVLTADGNNNTQTSFALGDAIQYEAQVNNATGMTVTALFTFLATGPQQIFSWSGSKSVSTGTSTITIASTVPVNALKGTYTFTVTLTYNGQSSVEANTFTVEPTLQSDYSQFWSGYVVQGKTVNQVTYTVVKGSWTVPTAQCSPGETTRAAIWVGIGGIEGDKYLEQIGTSADCNNGKPHYWAWYEMFPKDPVPINCGTGLKANDKISLAEVTSLGGGHFSLAIDTPECSFETTRTQQGAELNSAEWVVEDLPHGGCGGGQCPLTHFVTGNQPFINFSSCSANGNHITANPLLRSFAMTDNGESNGTLKAFPLHTTSGDTAFSVEWVHG